MNEIPGKQILEEVAAELDIDPSFIEKDWYVTQLIAEMSHFKFMDAQIVFTGGTALSKAHRIIKRFSEDTDFRIISNEINTLSKSQQRKILSDFKKNIVEHLKKTFSIDDTLIKSRNDNRFISLDIDYPTLFNRKESLRPHILVEFTFTTMAIDPIKLPVSSLANELMEKLPEVSSIYCTDPVENACDKLSALIWRVADRDRTSADDDATIVRHLYDLAAMGKTVITHPKFKKLAIDTIQKDDERSEKIKGLSLEEKVSGSLNRLKEDKIYEKEYGTFVKGMFYGNEQVHEFKEAIVQLENLTGFIKCID
jgi:hypothetical protein